ncbi:MAG: DUF814 domain-containing protein [Campylobacter sp.]|nr:DUF814 domain-containing protein [Campylobacter sp.]
MKYNELLQIKDFFGAFKKIDFIKRIDDNVLELSLDRQKFILDLNRNQSAIYTARLQSKDYNAPFDFMLKKYFSNAILTKVIVPENNRILRFFALAHKAYKSFESVIDFEFTGKNTNVILSDSKGIIIEALRHMDKNYRVIKPHQNLTPLKPYKINEEFKKIVNFTTYFEQKFKELYETKLQNSKKLKLSQMQKKIEKFKLLLEGLEDEKKLLLNAEILSQKADVLFANLSFLKDYERKFRLKDFEGKDLEFKLISSPKQSANDFYKQAKKLKQRAKNIHIQKQNLEEKLEFYKKLEKLLAQSESIFELEVLLPKKSKNSSKKDDEKDLSVENFYFKDFKISVGKNQKGNENLLKNAKKNDIWLHIKDVPSAHTLIHSNKQKISEEVIEFAAKLCANFSNLKQGAYLVDYTTRNFVKVKQKAFVEYTNFKSVKIKKD